MIYVTGDLHGDAARLNEEDFPEQAEMTKDDYVVVLGDFGLVWFGTDEENKQLDWLNGRPFTTLFIDGNHENFDLLYEYPIKDFCGGKVHKVRDSVLHLMRGYVFNICGKSIFTFGGARSHDIWYLLNPKDADFEERRRDLNSRMMFYRIVGKTWWEQEMPTVVEMERGISNLEKVGNKVDFVFTHCPPWDVGAAMRFPDKDTLNMYLNEIEWKIDFGRWYFGHLHEDSIMFGKYICMYYLIERIV